MRELDADLFNVACDAIVITTNGFVKNDGTAVMGRGVARVAARKWPNFRKLLGDTLKQFGNCTIHFRFLAEDLSVITMPVKDNWWELARLDLVERSAREMVAIANKYPEWKAICLPRPGCGNGQLCWESCGDTCLGSVKEVLAPILDDRFVVVFPVNNWSQLVSAFPGEGLLEGEAPQTNAELDAQDVEAPADDLTEEECDGDFD